MHRYRYIYLTVRIYVKILQFLCWLQSQIKINTALFLFLVFLKISGGIYPPYPPPPLHPPLILIALLMPLSFVSYKISCFYTISIVFFNVSMYVYLRF